MTTKMKNPRTIGPTG
jgi:hypothetical protein